MRKKITPQDYHTLADKRGFKWLGPMPNSTNTVTIWQCSNSHKWETKYSNIFRGRGCPACSNRLPKTPQDYHALAKKRGFRWRGPFPKSTNVKTGWQCEKDHTWETKYGNIKAGKGCPVCTNLRRSEAKKANPATKRRKVITPKDYRVLAKKRGFKWLGPEVRTTNIKTGWECEQGHQWQAPYGIFIYGESGCPVCSKARLTRTPKTKPPKPPIKKREPKQKQNIATPEMIAKLHRGRAAAEARRAEQLRILNEAGITDKPTQTAILLAY